MFHLEIENVRCFTKPAPIPVKRLTILVGENSTGKTSFLALLRMALNLYSRDNVSPDFNERPYDFGAYDQIAHYHGGSKGRAKSFHIGLVGRHEIGEVSSRWKFIKVGSQPALCEYTAQYGEYALDMKCDRSNEKNYKYSSFTHEAGSNANDAMEQIVTTRYLPPLLLARYFRIERMKEKQRSQIHAATQVLNFAPIAIAPVRSHPARTYDPRSEFFDPEGGHIPMFLARTRFTEKEAWEKLREGLVEFGDQSGLFSSIDIRSLGKSDSDPFQIQVKISGPSSNITDVGYGVSQVLPIVVELLSARRRNHVFLLQQPEVHLHPRGQAGFGSFLSKYVTKSGNGIVVETHSDHLIDRIRMDIRDRKTALKHTDVGILYFERVGAEVSIHPIGINPDGSLSDQPGTYRSFFMREEKRLLGF